MENDKYNNGHGSLALPVNNNDEIKRLKKLCECDRIISDTNLSEFHNLLKINEKKKNIIFEFDEYNEDFEDEFFKLIYILDLPENTHSLTRIETNLPSCLKYEFCSGLSHMYMRKFSPLTRGLQGPAIAVAAIATAFLVKPECWNEFIIDQVLEDGDNYYIDSYKEIKIHDRRVLTLLDFKQDLEIQKTHRVFFKTDDPFCAGTFRSETPKELHIAKALCLFFKKYDLGVLTSSVLNIAIWKNSKNFNIFDAQPRFDNCNICEPEGNGTAKLIIVQNLSGVLFIILQKSNVKNESFILYGITIMNTKKLSELADDNKSVLLPQRRPSGYCVKEKFRAIAQGSYHIHHPIFPEEFHGRGHLIVAVITLIYSKLLNASKWTTPIIDLILNYSNTYLTDIIRVLGKILDETFKISISDLLTDITFGVYTAKIKVQENVFPGENNSIESLEFGIRQFFKKYSLGILEIKETFFAIWNQNNKFYLFDPFACNNEGFRVNSDDDEEMECYQQAASCITMNSSVNELIEIVAENTEYKSKDPFIIHGFNILYVKTGSLNNDLDEKVVFREKNINCRLLRSLSRSSTSINECNNIVSTSAHPTFVTDIPVNKKIQFPELMNQTELFIITFDENDTAESKKLCSGVSYYEVVKPCRLKLKGSINCMNKEFQVTSQGRQGLIIAIAALTQTKQVNLLEWSSIQIDKVIITGDKTYNKIAKLILDELEKQKSQTDIKDQGANTCKKPKMLNKLDFTMLPKNMKVNDIDIVLGWKTNIVEGAANPLINLEEGFQLYFEKFNELILENKNLMYAIWKNKDKYFILNPYGSDRDGWRNTSKPAALFIVNSISELTYFCYGLFEYNQYNFIFHYVQIKIQLLDNDGYNVNLPQFKALEKYTIKFLPITGYDFIKLTEEEKCSKFPTINNSQNKDNLDINKNQEGSKINQKNETTSADNKNVIINLFEKSKELKHTDAPMKLNFSLVTDAVKIDKYEKFEENLEIYYEKLKQRHPPPFVASKNNFCNLLNTKLVSKSIYSLNSKFSVHSKLLTEKKKMLEWPEHNTVTNLNEKSYKSKIVTLSSKQYFVLQSLPSGLIPIRAINDNFIQDKYITENKEEEKEEAECKDKSEEIEMIQESLVPSIIPCGPYIKTPDPKKLPDYAQKSDKIFSLNEKEQDDILLKKLVCSTENLFLDIMLSDFKKNEKSPDFQCQKLTQNCTEVEEETNLIPIFYGFMKTDDKNIGVINGNSYLKDRESIEFYHYKTCYFSAILCVLIKINMDINCFHGKILDKIISIAKKISFDRGNLRYKMKRWFRNFHILGIKYNFILKQSQYFDPENYESDALEFGLQSFFCKNQSGILIFGNISYAFWSANDMFYLLDSYQCDKNGRANTVGTCCLMQFCNFTAFINRIVENTGKPFKKPYRLYTILITHLEKKIHHNIRKKRITYLEPQFKEDYANTVENRTVELNEFQTEISSMEISDWIYEDKVDVVPLDTRASKFIAFKNYNASVLEVEILNTEIEKTRIILYDTKFYKNYLYRQSFDLCIIAWSQIYEPRIWKVQVFQALYQACKEYTLDSLLATEDTTVQNITDNLMSEFNISNYCFRVVFAPLHTGSLYTTKGWNLTMCLKKIFDSPVYTGAILVCGKIHIGVMKKDYRFYAWWTIKRNKSIKMIVSDNPLDYTKLLVKEINKPSETQFLIRIVTISHVKIFGPNCSDIEGLHQAIETSTSDPEIHRKQTAVNSRNDVFKPINKSHKPVFILGSVALSDRDTVIEPCMKRCYFVALFAVVMKRDIIQNPLPGMIDKVLELAESSYKLFKKPKYHTEHILKGVIFMDRVFDLRDCASQLINLLDEKKTFFTCVRNELRQFFSKHTSGIIQFSNCCYGFWYSDAFNCFYYLDPYQCDKSGKKVNIRGAGCLCIFSSICNMVEHMYINQYKQTTGFFIHRIHVESINTSPYITFKEDPIWVYLDYHWSYTHTVINKSLKIKNISGKVSYEKSKKLMWKNYMIEIPNLIYSLWGSLSIFHSKYYQTGKNQAAVGIAIFAFQNLYHPSEWSPSVLNAAIICGDYYYKESKKVPPRCLNKLNLLNFFKISSFQWNIEFKPEICSHLYANSNQRNLGDAFEMAFKRSSNVLFQCEQKILAIIQTSDSFYVMDSSWTGPPLFNRNRGAIYIIRCKNKNTLIYVVTKILNTNQKLEFVLIPIKLIFIQQSCHSKDMTFHINLKQLLDKPVSSVPEKIINHSNLVSGSTAISDEDSYLCYKRSLKLGLANRLELEKSDIIAKNECNKNKCKSFEKKQMIVTKSKLLESRELSDKDSVNSNISFTSLLDKNINYPDIVNLVKNNGRNITQKKSLCKRKKFEKKTSFIYDELQSSFDRYNAEMKKQFYKSKDHEYIEPK